MPRQFQLFIRGAAVAALSASVLIPASVAGQTRRPAPDLDRIPKIVMDALTAKFPDARIDKWSREKEQGREIYDFEFRQGDKKFEADIFTDGTFQNWEREIPASDLPDPVMSVVRQKYPNATVKQAMAVTAVSNGKETLEGYEILLERAGRKEVEITVAPDGRILEG